MYILLLSRCKIIDVSLKKKKKYMKFLKGNIIIFRPSIARSSLQKGKKQNRKIYESEQDQ